MSEPKPPLTLKFKVSGGFVLKYLVKLDII